MKEEVKALGATGGAMGLSSLALAFGLCCVSPWAVALLGVGGAVLMARMAFLQPYLIGVAAILLVLAFWYAYRNKPAAGGISRRWRWVIWGGALLVLLADIVAFAPQLFFS